MILQSRKSSRIVRVNVEDQIVGVDEDMTLEGANTITVQLNDPDWLLVNADILDLDTNNRLDHVETKYGDDWYRLVKVSPADNDLSLVFEHRVVSILRRYKKKKLHRRVAGYTRAMFLKALVDEARKDGNAIEFYCPRLTQSQEIAKGKTPKQPTDPAGVKGFSKATKLTVKGSKANKQQRANAAVALNVADQLLASSGSGIKYRVNVALMEALITESSITNLVGGDRDSAGILQVRRSHSGVNPRNIEQVVTIFLSKGYTGRGGAIELAATTTKRPHEIAQAVQGSAFSDGSNYKANEAEAVKWVKAFHAITDPSDMTDSTNVDAAYYFGRGYDSTGGVIDEEDSWEAMNRLAADVEWRVYAKGNKVYFLSDDDLYTQKPTLTFSRLSARVKSISFDWDEGKPVQECRVTIQRQDVKPGTTVEITDAGPASHRWLVWEALRKRESADTDFTLRSPVKPKKEPAPEQETVTIEDKPGSRKASAFQALLAAMKAVDKNAPSYLYGGGHGQSLDNLPPSTKFDCSSSCSWVLHRAGLFKPNSAWVSGEFAARYGKPGEGRLFTVWANANHVWIELKEGPYKRFDTGGPRTIHQQTHGGGPQYSTLSSGARLSTQERSSGGFTPRHFEGM